MMPSRQGDGLSRFAVAEDTINKIQDSDKNIRAR